MATVLILSDKGDGAPVAYRLAQEGHIVKMWIKDTSVKLKGFRNPSQIGDPKRFIEQYDLILCGIVGMGDMADRFRDEGRLVLGGGSFNDKIELDREYGEKVCKSLTKLTIPDSTTIDTAEELLKYLEGSKTPQVIKPMNNKPTNLLLVSIDPENRMLKSAVEERGKELVPCLVQERVEGIEISTQGWFTGKEFLDDFDHTMEKKRFLEGDKGPNTGCMGNVVWMTKQDKLVEDGLTPLAPLLTKVNYVGPIDVNCLVTEKSANFLEWTARLGYDAIQAQAELIKGSLFDFLYGVATWKKDFNFSQNYSMAIRLSAPPYPAYKGIEETRGIQYIDVPKEAEKHVWFADIYKESERILCAGNYGILCSVTAKGESVRECKRRIFRTINNIVVSSDVQYRSDIGNQVEENKGKLQEWGWLL